MPSAALPLLVTKVPSAAEVAARWVVRHWVSRLAGDFDSLPAGVLAQ